MADLKISQLPAATVPLSGAEITPIIQGGVTKQVATAALALTPLATQAGAGMVGFTPVGGIVATSVQGAIAEVVSDLALSSGSSLVGFMQSGTGTVASTVQSKLRESVSVFDFMTAAQIADIQAGTLSIDVTAGLQAAIDSLKPLYIPAGKYKYTALTGLNRSNLSIVGAGSTVTTLVYTGTTEAFKIDGNGGFVNEVTVGGFTVKGNTNATSIFYLRDVARGKFFDLNAYEANNAAGIGFNLLGVQLCNFKSIVCSQNRQAMSFPPNVGCYVAVSGMLLNSTNNVFDQCYFEGGVTAGDMKIGMWLQTADQTTVIGGSSEAQRTYGLLIGTASKMNTFIGTGFESASSTADISDGGLNNTLINCYSSKSVLLGGRGATIEGGYFERVEVQAAAVRTKLNNFVYNNWTSGSGGLFDAGTGTVSNNLFDFDTSSYRQDIKSRFFAYVPASVANATGNGLASTLSMTEVYDDNNNFIGTTFTAPITSRYQLNAGVNLSALTVAATLATLEIVTTNRILTQQMGLNPKAGALQASLSVGGVVDMTAGQTAFVRVTVAGMVGDTATILGNATTMWSFFSGHIT